MKPEVTATRKYSPKHEDVFRPGDEEGKSRRDEEVIPGKSRQKGREHDRSSIEREGEKDDGGEEGDGGGPIPDIVGQEDIEACDDGYREDGRGVLPCRGGLDLPRGLLAEDFLDRALLDYRRRARCPIP